MPGGSSPLRSVGIETAECEDFSSSLDAGCFYCDDTRPVLFEDVLGSWGLTQDQNL